MSEKIENKPRALDDIGYWVNFEKAGVIYYSLGSKTVDRYIKVSEKQVEPIMEVVKLLDGNNTLDYIEEYLKSEKNLIVDVKKLFNLLKSVGFIEGFKSDRVNGEVSIVGLELVSISFPDTTKSIKKIAKVLLITWKSIFLISVVALILGIFTKYHSFLEIRRSLFTVGDSHVVGLFWLAGFFFLTSLFHELSHWCIAVNYGIRPDKLKITLYSGILPIIYVKINGLYTLNRKERIKVMSAGMLTNALIFIISITVVLWIDFPKNVSDVIIKIALANGYMVVTNLMPFSITDGYFIFTWLFGVSNLRINLIKSLKEKSKNKSYKLNKISIIYLTISLGLFVFAICSTIIWSYNIINEIFKFIPFSFGKYTLVVIIGILLLFIVGNIFLKIKKYINE
jgi:putative peptide zinc metalloprotease protein